MMTLLRGLGDANLSRVRFRLKWNECGWNKMAISFWPKWKEVHFIVAKMKWSSHSGQNTLLWIQKAKLKMQISLQRSGQNWMSGLWTEALRPATADKFIRNCTQGTMLLWYFLDQKFFFVQNFVGPNFFFTQPDFFLILNFLDQNVFWTNNLKCTFID